MIKREKKKLHRKVDEAGCKHDKASCIKAAIKICEWDIQRLKQSMVALQLLFHRNLERWLSTDAQPDQAPFEIKEDSKDALCYKVAACACIIFESIIAGWVAQGIGLPLWSGIIIAVLATFIFHGAFVFGLRQVERPRETIGKMRRWLLYPSLGIFCTSFMCLLWARLAYGELVVTLLPLFRVSLWMTTIGLILLAGALLAAASLLGWSRRASEEYSAMSREKTESEINREMFLDRLKELKLNSPSHPLRDQTTTSQPLKDTKSDLSWAGKQLSLFLVATLLALYSCNQVPIAAQSKELSNEVLTESLLYREMHVYVDESQSPDEKVLASTTCNLRNELQEIVESYNVTKLQVYHFDQDGWNAERKALIEFPKLILPQSNPIDPGELGTLINISESVKAHRDAQLATEKAKMWNKYRQQVKEVLTQVDESTLLPKIPVVEPPCTDLNGVLRRISYSSSAIPHLVFMITDGAECCASSIHNIPPPKSDVTLVIILVPEKSEEPGQTLKKGFEQFALRSSQFSEAVPWAVVVPYFEGGLGNILAEAITINDTLGKKQ